MKLHNRGDANTIVIWVLLAVIGIFTLVILAFGYFVYLEMK